LDNPYHSATHAADMLQSMHSILTHGGLVGGYADHLRLLACYLAAAGHDYGHVGFTNDFVIAAHHPLALLYNDKVSLPPNGAFTPPNDYMQWRARCTHISLSLVVGRKELRTLGARLIHL
jgi:hypothetical protein